MQPRSASVIERARGTLAPREAREGQGGEGVVVGLYVAPAAGAPMRPLNAVRAVPGRGLEGDRYFQGAGTFSRDPKRGSEVTLIAREDLVALEQETGIRLDFGEARRNVVTQGVSLGDLVGREVRIGEAILRGTRLSEPCVRLARLTHQEILRGLLHKSGLRAEVLREGVIRVGDPIQLVLSPVR